jgi:inhibitor of cysteine peptidase
MKSNASSTRYMAAFAAAIALFAFAACGDEDAGDVVSTPTIEASTTPAVGPPSATPAIPTSPTPTPTAPLEVQFTELNEGEVIAVPEGGEIVVALASNPSTGLSWWVRDLPAQLQLNGEPVFVPAGSTEPVLGAPGTEVFRFRAAELGSGDLVLQYALSFASKDPEDVYSITVVVGDQP